MSNIIPATVAASPERATSAIHAANARPAHAAVLSADCRATAGAYANGPDDAGNARAVPDDDAEHAAELHEHDARDDAG